MPALRRVALFFFVLMASGCSDPVHDDAVDALGSEKPGVPKGATHRPGQPCLTCHGGEGPANLVMSFGGTIYAHLTSDVAAKGATVHVVDAHGRTFETPTNCVGNFWIPEDAFEATFPVQAAVTLGNYPEVMRTEMHGDGSCNNCHTNPESASSPGHMWVLPDSIPATPPSCN